MDQIPTEKRQSLLALQSSCKCGPRKGITLQVLSIVVLLTPLLRITARADDVLLTAGFTSNSEGFTYADDKFRGTSKPAYASGNYAAAGGFAGGGLRVNVGGVDNTTVQGMSGGWSKGFVVSGAATVSVTLKYRLIFTKGYDPGECGQALVAIDGTLVGPGPGDFLQQFCGANPNLTADQDSGWQTVTFGVALAGGSHTLTVGGWNNQKTTATENMRVFFDDLTVTRPSTSGTTLLTASFTSGSEGFTYADDRFRGTSKPAYASGNYAAAGGFAGGGLRVNVGGVDNTTVQGMSGGWSKGFTVNGSATVNVTLKYRLIFAKGYDPGECGQALVAIDGTLVGPGPGDFLQQFCGANPNLTADQDSGWQTVTFGVALAGGSHTLTVGGWNNQKTTATENMRVFFDDLTVTQSGTPTQPETNCSDGLDNDSDSAIDCADSDCASSPSCSQGALIFSDDFNDGNANGWTVVNDSGRAPNWQVLNGKYSETNVVGKDSNSYPTGSYSYYSGGSTWTDYQVTVEVTPVPNASDLDTVGLMFRYQDNNNYYRFIMSRDQGFSRLERKVGGVFKTLAFNGRGFTFNQLHEITIDVKGVKIFVYLNGDPLFSETESDLASGTVALFAQNEARFDNVEIRENSAAPQVILAAPLAHSVATGSSVSAVAVATGVPAGGKIKFILDSGTANESTFSTLGEPLSSGTFSSVARGNHTVDALIVNSSGAPLTNLSAHDHNVQIGTRGNQFVAFGDSITKGDMDDLSSDDASADGRNINWGYTPILNDLLTSSLNKPTIVMNEGISGTTSANGANRIGATKARYSSARYWLIQFGTNDSNATMPPPSGKGLQSGDPGYSGSYKDNLQRIITSLRNANKIPLLAKVPITLGPCSTCMPYSNPLTASRNLLIQEYNEVVDELVDALVAAGVIPASYTPPDFYSYFAAHQNEFSDNLHPNGNGYVSMANLWFTALSQSGLLN